MTEEEMLETTQETCTICGKKYQDTHVMPRAFFAPYWCLKCEEEVNAVSGGWVAAAYRGNRHD